MESRRVLFRSGGRRAPRRRRIPEAHRPGHQGRRRGGQGQGTGTDGGMRGRDSGFGIRDWARQENADAGTTSENRTLLLFRIRSEEHTSELQSLMRISYAVFCLKKNNKQINNPNISLIYRSKNN